MTSKFSIKESTQKIANGMKDTKYQTQDRNNRPIFISQEEIESQRRTHSDALVNFAVDNIPINPDTQHIFNDYVEGRILTTKEVKELLHAYYSDQQD